MWFVAYLFVFTLLLLPIFSLAKVKGFDGLKDKVDSLFRSPVAHFALALPFVLYIFWLYIDWPEQGSLIDDWYVFISSITFFALGFLLGALPSFWNTCLKYRKLFLAVALTFALLLFINYYWDWNTNKPDIQDTHLYIYGVLNGIHIWTIILASIGYAMKYLNFANKRLSYLNSAVYPYYITHQAVIVASGYYVLQWDTSILVKLIVLIVICMLSIWSLYHFIIRRPKLTRLLFGMRWKR